MSAYKMVMITYNEAMDYEVMDVLEHCVLKNYTKIVSAYGRGTSSGTHLGNDIWPGKNNILFVSCSADDERQLMTCIRTLRSKLSKEGLKAFVMPVEEIS